MQFYVTVHQDGIGTVNKSYKTANIIARNENEYIRGSLEYFEPFDICITSRRYSSNTESVSSRSFFEKFRILTVPGPNQKHGKKLIVKTIIYVTCISCKMYFNIAYMYIVDSFSTLYIYNIILHVFESDSKDLILF